MVGVGTTAGIWVMRRQVEAGFAQQAQAFLTTPLFSMVAFAALVGAAIRFPLQSADAQAIDATATISIFDAAVARLPFAFLRTFPAGTICRPLMISGWPRSCTTSRPRRTVHPAYIWGGLLLVIEQALRIPIGDNCRVAGDRGRHS